MGITILVCLAPLAFLPPHRPFLTSLTPEGSMCPSESEIDNTPGPPSFRLSRFSLQHLLCGEWRALSLGLTRMPFSSSGPHLVQPSLSPCLPAAKEWPAVLPGCPGPPVPAQVAPHRGPQEGRAPLSFAHSGPAKAEDWHLAVFQGAVLQTSC